LTKGEMGTNAKETKGVGKVLINALGFLSYLFGPLMLFAAVFGMIGSMFMSTNHYFRLNELKGMKRIAVANQKGEDGRSGKEKKRG
jgi:hypothetical protein